MDGLLRDLRQALRMCGQAPGFTMAAVSTLALGIASNTAIFSVVNTVLLKSFPYPEPERIVMFQNVFATGRSGSASPTEFNWWREQAAFEQVSAYEFQVANWTGAAAAEQVPVMRASADFLKLCGARAVYGRMFRVEDDLPGARKRRCCRMDSGSAGSRATRG